MPHPRLASDASSSPDRQRLIFAGRQCEDDDGKQLEDDTGKQLEDDDDIKGFQAGRSPPIDNAKAKIQDKDGIPPDQQRLTLASPAMPHLRRQAARGRRHQNPLATLNDNVKAKIQDKEGIPQSQSAPPSTATMVRAKSPPPRDMLPDELRDKTDEERRQLAIAAYQTEGGSLRNVCRRFFVSEATVRTRLKGIPLRADYTDEKRTLSTTETRVLADWCKKMAARFAPLSREQVIFEATKILHRVSPEAKAAGRIMSKSWYYDTFLKDNPDLKVTKSCGLDRTKTMFASLERAEASFQSVAENVDKYQVKAENIWNMDEKGFMIGARTSLCLHLYAHQQSGFFA